MSYAHFYQVHTSLDSIPSLFCFVIGRRKIDVQIHFAELGLADILLKMFSRLSWDAAPEELNHSIDHGPNCECNPLSALRVQYLRLIHNFFDRDFHNNSNKTHMLSAAENQILSSYQKNHLYQHYLLSLLASPELNNHLHQQLISSSFATLSAAPQDLQSSLGRLSPEQFGILRNIMKILKLQKSDSIYRFWLTSCLESFVRGLGYSQQLLVSSNDILAHLVKQICDEYSPDSCLSRMEISASSSTANLLGTTVGTGAASSSQLQSLLSTSTLQSSYDFLGEIIKFNFTIIEKFEEILLEKKLIHSFFTILSTHLIDSNVFLRALFVTFDSYHENYQIFQKKNMKRLMNHIPNSHSSTPFRHLEDEQVVFGGEKEGDSENAEEISLEKRISSECRQDVFKLMPNEYYYLPPSCPHRHVLYESSATGISSKTGFFPTPPQEVNFTPDVTQMDHPIASVGYLSHSWIHFQPEIISSEASFLLQQHQELLSSAPHQPISSSKPSPYSSKMRSQKKSLQKKGAASEKSRSKPDSILPISSLNINDALSSLRNIFRGSNASHNNHHEGIKSNETPEKNSTSDSESKCELGYRELLALEIERENRLKVCMDVVVSTSDRKKVGASAEPEDSKQSNIYPSDEKSCGGIFEWNLPPSVRHLSTYLEQQKEHILYGLMTIVTLRSINHENICCINTSLLIFIYAHKRYLSSLRPFPVHSPSSVFLGRNQIPKLLTGVKYLSQTNHLNHLPFGSEEYSVLRNFRELLWYWTEYYTRRGRDRLSLEFSTHVPFSKWKEIVGMSSPPPSLSFLCIPLHQS